MITNGQTQSRLWRLSFTERRSLLIFGDLLIAFLSLGVALYYWGSSERFLGPSLEFLQKRVPFWFYLLPLIWLVLLVELYDVHRASDLRKTVGGIVTAAIVGSTLYFFLFFYYVNPPTSLLPRRGVAGFVIAASLLTLAWRWFYIRVFTAPQFMRRVLLVGGGRTGVYFLQALKELKTQPFALVGIIDDNHRKLGTFLEGYQVIGTSEHLQKIVDDNQVTELIVSISGEMQGGMFQALLDAQERGVVITRMPVAFEEILSRVPIQALEGDWIIRSFVDQIRVSGFYKIAKRALDILGALVGLLIFLFFFPFIAVLILIDDGSPILYAQMRSGKGGEPYKILKFRTMRKDAEADGLPKSAKEDDERATRIGHILRRTHLDELPQFLNVLRGDMSLVGPRAERPELVAVFQGHIPFYRARLLVKPGITGWAQINYGYAATIKETLIKLEYDLYYIKHRNLLTDIVILLRTPQTMFGFRGR